MTDKSPMTPRGKKLLEEELKNLLSVERPNVIKAIEEARDHGDLSENAEYDAAKEKQALVEGRINELQAKLATAEVVNPADLNEDRVVFGATVSLENCDTGEEVKYQIVGVDEADVKAGLISVMSPMSRAMIGKREGDAITVNTPSGDNEFEIAKIEYI